MQSKMMLPTRQPKIMGKQQSKQSKRKQQGLKQKGPYREATSEGSHLRQSTSTKKIWIPKDQIHNKASPLILLKATCLGSRLVRSYVASQDLLRSQGYYRGCSKVWLPKQSLQSLDLSKPQSSQQASTSKSTRTWEPIKVSTSLHGQGNTCDSLKPIKIWLPKRQSDQHEKVEVISKSIRKVKKADINDLENGVSQPSTLTIKERARQLQALLHGKSSLQ